MYAGKFEVDVSYNEDSKPVYHVSTTKNYGRITANVTKGKDGDVTVKIEAEEVDATTLGVQMLKSQTEIISSLAGLIPK